MINLYGYSILFEYFLQEMEKLEVVVEASDLNLEAASDSGADDEAIANQQRIALSLRFSFYDRLPANAPGPASSPASAEEAPN